VAQGGSTSAIFRGYHGAFAGPGGTTVRYAVVAYPRGMVNNASVSFLSDLDSMTKTASHEIAEAATDPDVNYGTLGWYDPAGGEIGDINNDRVMYINGYAMQRVVDQSDYNMTPAQAASDRPVSFLLTNVGGSVVEVTGGLSTVVATGVQWVSDQGIDNQGHAMVDLLFSNGSAWEFHDTGGAGTFTFLGNNVYRAAAGQGVSYFLDAAANVWEYDDATRVTALRDTNAWFIDAGTDHFGVNTFSVIEYPMNGDLWTRGDESGWHHINSNVSWVSTGRQGNLDYVDGIWNAHYYQEVSGLTYIFASNVLQVTTGTDENGNVMLYWIHLNGTAQGWNSGVGTFNVATPDTVTWFGKARQGLVDVTLYNPTSGSYAYEYDATGFANFLGWGVYAV
jgi:hypothetical protein